MANVEIPLSTLFWLSGSVRDSDWYSSLDPVDLDVLRNVKTALADGLNVLVGDSDQYAPVRADNDSSTQEEV